MSSTSSIPSAGPRLGTSVLILAELRVRGVRAGDVTGKSDPFVRVRAGTHTWTSSVKNQCLAAEWVGEEVRFGPSVEFDDGVDVLYVDVLDRDLFGPPEMLGSLCVFFGDMFSHTPPSVPPAAAAAAAAATATGGLALPLSKESTGWRTLLYNGAVCGEIHLSLRAYGWRALPASASTTTAAAAAASLFAPVGPPAPSPTGALQHTAAPGAPRPAPAPAEPAVPSGPPNCVKVMLHQVRGIIPRWKGRANPFAHIVVGEHTVTTRVVDSLCDAVFQEGWAFPTIDKSARVSVTIRHRRWLLGPQFEGQFSFLFSEWLAAAGTSTHVRRWCRLRNEDNKEDKPRGEVELELHWTHVHAFADVAASAQASAWKPLRLTPLLELEAPAAVGADAAARPDGTTGDVVLPDAGAVGGAETVTDLSAGEAASRHAAMEQQSVREGDWQIHVHVIEARNLKAENRNGTSDPVVYVEVAGQKQHTITMKNVTSGVFDHRFLFQLPKLSAAEVDALLATVSVFDANTVARNVLIGRFTFDAMDVYHQAQHAYQRRWVGLIDPLNASDKGLQGFLKVSIVVLGPGDKLPPVGAPAAAASLGAAAAAAVASTPAGPAIASTLTAIFGRKAAQVVADDAEIETIGEETTADALVLLPPMVRRTLRWLVVDLYRAEGLPVMDDLPTSQPGIDAFAEVTFGGSAPVRTKWITRKGRTGLAVDWLEELWVPYQEPFLSSRVEVSVWDYDWVTENERVGTLTLRMSDVLAAGGIPPAWRPLYGGPTVRRPGDTRAMRNMNRFPTVASTYRGRVLLSARTADRDPDDTREVAHTKRMIPVPHELMPAMERYRLRALIIAGDELPAFTSDLAVQLGMRNSDLGVAVCIGGRAPVYTPRVKVVQHRARWCTMLQTDISLPVCAHPDAVLPDAFVYLYRGDYSKSEALHVCFARIPTAQLQRCGAAASIPYWQTLREDTAVNALGDEESAGSVLMRIELEPVADAAASAGEWEAELQDLATLTPYELRVHVYQGRNLPSADENGSLDPYLRVSLEGQQCRTDVRYATVCPAWYQTLSMDVMLPTLRFSPQVHVELWDADSITRDDFVAEMRFNLNSADTVMSSAERLPAELPRPRWYALTRLDTGHTNVGGTPPQTDHGELLLGFQLIPKRALTALVPSIPASINPIPSDGSTAYFVDCIVLGCRGLRSPDVFPLAAPSVTFDFGDRSRSRGGAGVAGSVALVQTGKSRFPSPCNPNFCQRLIVPVRLPRDAYFAPAINFTVSDTRVGGLWLPLLGSGVVLLRDKIPWSDTYQPPRGRVDCGVNPYMRGAADGALLATSGTARSTEVQAATPMPPWAGLPTVEVIASIDGRKQGAARAANEVVAAPGQQFAYISGRRVNVPDGVNVSQVCVVTEAHMAAGASFDDALRVGIAEVSAVASLTSTVPEVGSEEASRRRASRVGVDPRALRPETLTLGLFSNVAESQIQQSTRKAGPPPSRSLVPDDDAEEDDTEEAYLLAASARDSLEEGEVRGDVVFDVAPAPLRGGKSAGNTSGADPRVPKAALHASTTAPDDASVLRTSSGKTGSINTRVAVSVVNAVARQHQASARHRSRASPRTPAPLHTDAIDSQARAYGIDLTKELLTRDAAEGVEDAKCVTYLRHRREYACELEDVFGSTPFERFDIIRGQRVGRGPWLADNARVVGALKAIIRLVDRADAPPPVDIANLLAPRTYLIRVYVLTGHGIAPRDASGKSDPYLLLRLGDAVISRKASRKMQTTEPRFFETFELATVLPGPSTLRLEAWDYDMLSADDFIGATEIDLEDRLFEPAWQSLGAEQQTATRYRPRPIESRCLWSPSASDVQGSLRMWVDILTPQEAAQYPVVDITPSPPVPYQLRAIVWKTRNVESGDVVTRMNDMYIRAVLEGATTQETDTHWRCRNGRGSFNWRMKWDLDLPRDFFRLTVQAWDYDITKYADCLGETTIDLAPIVRRALADPARGIHVFKSDPNHEPPPDDRWWGARLLDWAWYHCAACCCAARAGPPVPPPFEFLQAGWWRRTSGALLPCTSRCCPPPSIPLPAASPTAATQTGASYAGVGTSSFHPLRAALGMRSAAAAEDAANTLRSLMQYAGIDVRPTHAQWVKLQRIDRSSGTPTAHVTGEVLMTLELLPASVAERYPAGKGRDAPNAHPTLPPPAGRVRCSANPCYLLNACCGGRVLTSIVCCMLCLGVCVVALLGAPFVQAILTWLTAVPRGGQAAIWIIVALAFCGPPLFCYLRYVACPRRELYEEVTIDDWAAVPQGATALADGAPSSLADGEQAATGHAKERVDGDVEAAAKDDAAGAHACTGLRSA